jgi:DNA-binding cell septation regulator SpoVG
MSIKITDYRPYERKALKAFFTATLANGMVVHGLKLFAKEGGNRWIGLPSEKFTDKNGVEGFRPIVEFSNREACDSFRDAVLNAIDALKPKASQSRPAKAQIPDDEIPF